MPTCDYRVCEPARCEGVTDVDYIFVSHHHADHVGGLRVVQAIGRPEFPITDWENADPATVVMSETTYDRLADPSTSKRSTTTGGTPSSSSGTTARRWRSETASR